FARLNLKKAISENDQEASMFYFIDAHNILKREESDIYKFRQAGLYITYFERQFENLSKGNKVRFEHSLKEISKQYEIFISHEYPSGEIPPYQKESLENFRKTISSISEKRKRKLNI
ncbi:MAG: hypothetical protein WBF70_11550, partial [Aeromonas molluscorum]